MSKRSFLVTGSWAWDHLNTELGTFTIECDQSEEELNFPISPNEPLTPENFTDYYKHHRDIIEDSVAKILAAIDGSIMGQIDPGSIYEIISGINNIPTSNPSDRSEGQKIININLQLIHLCRLKRNDNTFCCVST